jgi:hypothetical protein
MSGPTPPLPVQVFTTCQGSAATTATPSVEPSAAILLQQYLGCVTARGWCRVAFETRSGLQHFDFSCQPSPTSSPCTPRKRRAHARRRAQESLRRAAWVERRRNRRSRPSGCPDKEVAVTAEAFIAAVETATTASWPTTAANTAAASATTVAAASYAAVATSAASATTAAAASYAAVAASEAAATPAAAAPRVASATTANNSRTRAAA